MIHPSYTELIEAINTNNEDDDTTMSVNSRYSLVLATSKRARQLIAGAKPMVEGAAGKKPLSIAIDELYQRKSKDPCTGRGNRGETAAAAEAAEAPAEVDSRGNCGDSRRAAAAEEAYRRISNGMCQNNLNTDQFSGTCFSIQNVV